MALMHEIGFLEPDKSAAASCSWRRLRLWNRRRQLRKAFGRCICASDGGDTGRTTSAVARVEEQIGGCSLRRSTGAVVYFHCQRRLSSSSSSNSSSSSSSSTYCISQAAMEGGEEGEEAWEAKPTY